ncbi:MAG: hypothetical protein H7250_05055 [Flavobacterium sp.]|nr:hypothetical protein [Flavobacterium sp.]
MKITISILILLSFYSIFGQNEKITESKYQFAKQIFENKYINTTYKKFGGKIIIENNNIIKYDEKTLKIPNLNEEFKLIFTLGIFYPNIVTGNQISEIKTKDELEKMSTSERVFYNMLRTDSLTIGRLEELKLLNPNYKTKRFLIWIYKNGIMNPTEWYFELQNKKAKKKTNLKEFIKNAELTFCKKGTLII